MNYCDDDGWVVPATEAYAEDIHEYWVRGLPQKVGCGNLVCRGCGERVRSAPGLVPRKVLGLVPGRTLTSQELYKLQDWAPGDLLESESPPPIHRLYACRCTAWCLVNEYLLDDPDREPGEPTFPWRCGGHPPIAFPYELDGIVLHEDMDVLSLLRRNFLGWSPPSARPMERATSVGWAAKFYARVVGTSLEARVSKAASTLLSDGKPRVRGCAAEFFSRFTDAEGHERLIELYHARPDLLDARFTRYAGMKTVRDAFTTALARRVEALGKRGQKDLDALSVLRAEAFRSGQTGYVIYILLEHDRDWLLANLGRCCERHPGAWREILRVLESAESDQIPRFAQCLVESRVVDATQLLRWARKALDWWGYDDVKEGVAAAVVKPTAS